MKMADALRMRVTSNEKLHDLLSRKKENIVFITENKYTNMVQHVNELKSGTRKKQSRDYQILKKYDVVRVGNIEKLICSMEEGNLTVKYYANISEIFDILHESHLKFGHGGRTCMVKAVNFKYKNVTSECIMMYLNLCLPCQKKAKQPRKRLVVRPMIFNDMNYRAQVDLIDIQTQQHDGYNWIMVYHEHLTKFVQLCPTKTKRAAEIAYLLMDIFCILGAPTVLQSDNGWELSWFMDSLDIVRAKAPLREQIMTSRTCYLPEWKQTEQVIGQRDFVLYRS